MSASVHIGVLLSEKKAMDLFGAKYSTEIYDKCPTDQKPNTNKENFCGKCGKDLTYKVQTRDGVDAVDDLHEEERQGLEMIVTRDPNLKKFILIGKKIAETETDEDFYTGVESFKISEKTIENIAHRLEKLGIKGQVKTYVVE
jgi:hypothetical protein